jgi:primosomal protein N' (replication factor Y)
MIQIVLRHRDPNIVTQAANKMAADLRSVFSNRVLGPNVPAVSRIQNLYIRHILLKFEVEASAEKAKEILREVTNQVIAEPKFKALWVNLDVDPM